jgi:hypothetical protein
VLNIDLTPQRMWERRLKTRDLGNILSPQYPASLSSTASPIAPCTVAKRHNFVLHSKSNRCVHDLATPVALEGHILLEYGAAFIVNLLTSFPISVYIFRVTEGHVLQITK